MGVNNNTSQIDVETIGEVRELHTIMSMTNLSIRLAANANDRIWQSERVVSYYRDRDC